LETEFGEVLNNDKEIYLKCDRGAQLVLWPYRAKEATEIQPLSEKLLREETNKHD